MKQLMKACAVAATLGVTMQVTAVMADDASPAAQQVTEQKVTLDIEKMTCAMCPITVRKAIEEVDGVLSVVADYDTKTAVVVFDPAKATIEAIAKASTNAGYPAIVQSSDSE